MIAARPIPANYISPTRFKYCRRRKFQRLCKEQGYFHYFFLTQLIILEKLKKGAMQRLQNEDSTAKKSTNVFIYFCLFHLVLKYFASF